MDALVSAFLAALFNLFTSSLATDFWTAITNLLAGFGGAT
jgi:hypothetical protein